MGPVCDDARSFDEEVLGLRVEKSIEGGWLSRLRERDPLRSAIDTTGSTGGRLGAATCGSDSGRGRGGSGTDPGACGNVLGEGVDATLEARGEWIGTRPGEAERANAWSCICGKDRRRATRARARVLEVAGVMLTRGEEKPRSLLLAPTMLELECPLMNGEALLAISVVPRVRGLWAGQPPELLGGSRSRSRCEKLMVRPGV